MNSLFKQINFSVIELLFYLTIASLITVSSIAFSLLMSIIDLKLTGRF